MSANHAINPYCLVLGALLAILFFPNAVSASELLTLDPAFQEVVVEETDDSAQAVITYKNDSDLVREVELFAHDFTQADALGSVAFITNSQSYPHTLASFLRLDKNHLVLQPGETQQVLVTIENRANLSPGGHYGAVVARVVVDNSQEMQQPILPALSSLILVRKIGGERYHLSLVGTDWQPNTVVAKLPSQLELTLRNDGNVHDIPRGTITATGLGGRTLLQGTVNEESLYVLPGTHRKIAVQVRTTTNPLPIDFVTLMLEGRGQYSNINFNWQESVISVAWYVPVVLLALLGAIGFGWHRRRKARHA